MKFGFWGVLLGMFVLLGGTASSAAAGDFTISFDRAIVNTGGVTPSQQPGFDYQASPPSTPSAVVTIRGTVSDEGGVTIPASGVVFKKETRAIEPLGSSYRIDWNSPGGFTGSFDETTGELNLEGDLEQTVSELSNACTTGPIPLTLSTEGSTSAGSGERFTSGLDGDGLLVGRWGYSPEVASGPDCNRAALNCLAKADLATATGEVSLSTETLLVQGLPSMRPCTRNVHWNEIVYSRNGRITYSRPTTGTVRDLTNAGKFFSNPEDGDNSPVLSPDSNSVAFIRRSSPFYPGGSSVVLIDLQGNELARIAEPGNTGDTFTDVAFAPDGQHVFYVRQGEMPGVYRSELNGRNVEEVSGGIPAIPELSFTDVDVSPDGTRLLVGMEGRRESNGHPIARTYVVQLESGEAKLLQKGASHGAWSPDGTKIVYESIGELINLGCSKGYCSADHRLYVMNADGTGANRLFAKRGSRSEISPDWSPDGSRITFTSDRSSYRGDFRIEIAKPDGKCLGIFTNGNLNTYSASWGTMFQSESEPIACGDRKLTPRIEIDQTPQREFHGKPTLWLGPLFKGNSLSVGKLSSGYYACTRFLSRECGKSISVETQDVCGRFPDEYETYDANFFNGAVKRRGAIVQFFGYRGERGVTSAEVLTGGRLVSLSFASRAPYGDPLPRRLYLHAVEQLRPVFEEGQDSRKLASARMAKGAIAYNQRILDFKANHSVAETAKKFTEPRISILHQLRAARRFEQLGVKPVSCAKP